MHPRRWIFAVASLTALSASALHATDFRLADGELQGTLKTRVVAGAGERLNDPSKHLVGKGFRSDGKPKGGDGADTADDGNLNYGKGDIYSSLFKVTSALDLKYKNVGIVASARAWYDNTQENHDVPQGSGASAFAADRPLDDHGLSKSNRFSGFMWLNAYVYGHFALDDESALCQCLQRQINYHTDLAVGLRQHRPLVPLLPQLRLQASEGVLENVLENGVH